MISTDASLWHTSADQRRGKQYRLPHPSETFGPRPQNGSLGEIRAAPAPKSRFTDAEAYPPAEYSFVLTDVVLPSLPAEGLLHGRVGRAWMAIRGMDVTAETIGIRSLRTKLSAPSISTACPRYQCKRD
jgi:hypothetical protein